MEGLEGLRGAEGGMEPEFHEIPSQGLSQTIKQNIFVHQHRDYHLLTISAEY